MEEGGSESWEDKVGEEIDVENLGGGAGRWADGACEVTSKRRIFRRGVRKGFGL
jgi:hypothetical protein